MYIVYLLTWPRSSLKYVGRTCNPDARLKAHRRDFKYLGLGKPCMEVLENNLSEEQAWVAEQNWIKFIGSTIDSEGLNKTYGGRFGAEVIVPSKKPHKVKEAPPSRRSKRVYTK